MTDEERLSILKQKVSDLKTSLAIKKSDIERLLKDLKEYGITTYKEAAEKVNSITSEIDLKEAQRTDELEKAEGYLRQYNV